MQATTPSQNGSLARPFTSSLTRRVLNQHLRETNPELVNRQRSVRSGDDANSDCLSETSSASGSNRSSLSWALSRIGNAINDRITLSPPPVAVKKEYTRAQTNRELSSGVAEQTRRYQRYGRSSTLDSVEPSSTASTLTAGNKSHESIRSRLGSPSDHEELPSGTTTPTYRTYTRTCSREFLSPTSSRGASPSPSTPAANPPTTVTCVINAIVPQLSVVLENGPLGLEKESPLPVRAADARKSPAPPSNSAAPEAKNPPANPAAPGIGPKCAPETEASIRNPLSGPAPKIAEIPLKCSAEPEEDRKSRRISRFLRSDFYERAREERTLSPPAPSPRPTPSGASKWQYEKYQPDETLVALTRNRLSTGDSCTSRHATSGTIPQHGSATRVPVPVTVSVRPLQTARPNSISVCQLSSNPIQLPSNPAENQSAMCRRNASSPPPVPIDAPTMPKQPDKTTELAEGQAVKVAAEMGVGGADAASVKARAPPKPEVSANPKNSPKLTVRRQFEHLINLAAAQFQRGQSPGKASNVGVSSVRNGQAAANQQAISNELKQLEDEIKNAAVVKAEAAAKSEVFQREPNPALAVKPDHLTVPKVNGSSRELPTGQKNWTAAPESRFVKENPASLQSLRQAFSPPRSAAYEPSGGLRFGSPPASCKSPTDDEYVRFARIKRLEALDNCEPGEEMPGTPTDSYESSSVCSDMRDHNDKESGDDESVSERIFRKSFYTRFNEPSKKKQHRRSVTSKDLLDIPTTMTSPKIPSDSETSLPPRLPVKAQRLSRDESAEAVMVRKFLSRADASSGTYERERRRSSSHRRQISDADEDGRYTAADDHRSECGSVSGMRSSMSRENSVARSVKSDVASPTCSEVASGSRDRDSRSYTRSYSTRTLTSSDNPASSSHADGYSSGSLGRRSFFSSNADHISSLPRRSNR